MMKISSKVIEVDVTKKAKLDVRPGIITIRFDEKSFFNTILVSNHGWDNKHYNEYIIHKKLNLITTNKIHLKCDCINGSIINGIQQPKLYSFVLDKLQDTYFPCQKQYTTKKINLF